MKTKKIFMLVAIIATLFGCEQKESVLGIDIETKKITLTEAGQTATVTATIAPSGAKADVKWETSNSAVATVSGNGLKATVTAVANGTAKITASAEGFVAECEVIVSIGEQGNTEDGDGSKENPYNVEQAISFTDATPQKDDVWVGGYIIGSVKEGTESNIQGKPDQYIFGVEGIRSTAVFIADRPEETNPEKVLVVRLNNAEGSATSTVRPALNLVDNCANYKTYIKVQGDIFRYFAVPGIQRLIDFEGGGKGSVGCGGSVNPGTGFNLPEMSISDLQALYKGTDVTLDGTKKIVGVVTSDLAGGNSTSLKNIIVTASNNQSGIMIRLSADNSTLNMGDKVDVKLAGTLTMYAGQFQLSLANANVSKVGTGTITPRKATITEIVANISSYNYCVVTTEGTFTGANGATVYGNSSAHATNKLTDGDQHLDIFISKFSTFVTTALPTNRVSVTGIAQSYGTDPVTHQLIIRNLNDVK